MERMVTKVSAAKCGDVDVLTKDVFLLPFLRL